MTASIYTPFHSKASIDDHSEEILVFTTYNFKV